MTPSGRPDGPAAPPGPPPGPGPAAPGGYGPPGAYGAAPAWGPPAYPVPYLNPDGSAAYGAPSPWGGGWRGASKGLPPSGPGSVADPLRRLAAVLLDVLVDLLAIGLVCVVVGVAVVQGAGLSYDDATVMRNRYGELVQTSSSAGDATAFVVLGGVLTYLLLVPIWDAFATARWGRTPGKAVLGIRPLVVEAFRGPPRRPSFSRMCGRQYVTLAMGFFWFVRLVDALFCTWDADGQCLHDKIASTVVVRDR